MATARTTRKSAPVIDFHTHINLPEVQAWFRRNAKGPNRPRPRVSRGGSKAGFTTGTTRTRMTKITCTRCRMRRAQPMW